MPSVCYSYMLTGKCYLGASWNDLASLSKTYLYRLLQLQSAILNHVSIHHFVPCSAQTPRRTHANDAGCISRCGRHSVDTWICGWPSTELSDWRLFQKKNNEFFGDISWPTVSPDLSTHDFFLRGYLKKCGFRHPYRYSCPSTGGRLTLNIIYRHLLAALRELLQTRLADLYNLKLRIS